MWGEEERWTDLSAPGNEETGLSVTGQGRWESGTERVKSLQENEKGAWKERWASEPRPGGPWGDWKQVSGRERMTSLPARVGVLPPPRRPERGRGGAVGFGVRWSEPPSHPCSLPLLHPRFHRGSAWSRRSPATLALVPRATRLLCPGAT